MVLQFLARAQALDPLPEDNLVLQRGDGFYRDHMFDADAAPRRLAADLQRDMLPALLRYEDKLGMAFSLEARTPFLDYRIVELAFRLPSDAKYADGWSKLLVRQAMQRDLPSAVCWRRDKQGFPTPTRHWLRGPSYQKVRERLLDTRIADAYLDRDSVERMLTRHHAGAVNAEWTLWRLLSFVTWLQVLPELSRTPARSASALAPSTRMC